MSTFAKMFDSEKYGQLVLFKQDNDESGSPELRVFVQPAGLGVCSVALEYEDSDDGWDKCEAHFDKADLNFVERVAQCLYGPPYNGFTSRPGG